MSRLPMLKPEGNVPESFGVAEENVLRVLALHGKYGNNMNQIAYQLNAHSDFAGAAQYEKGLVEWREIRDAMLELLKMVPEMVLKIILKMRVTTKRVSKM